MKDLKSRFPDVKVVSFFSDGAASQFKQKYLFVNLTFIKETYSLDDVSWHFFATSHGKGAVDGVGGTIKRLVWRSVLAKKHLVTDAASFVSCAKDTETEIVVKLVSAAEILADKQDLESKWANIKTLPSTQSVHYIRVVRPYVVQYKKYSLGSLANTFSFSVSSRPKKSRATVAKLRK